ncbi:CPBP family intramembrane glutamic endopeptidase [Lacrimispora sp.]|jgi:membrane protease YdiL (CAAX protease family)|uniref:CPBP family intramembrane glutamic endopeptidase n=1 Tax=Lacrimispora sp. TaxID=2719234 RepID=UPI002898BC9D|nr:type II CAAX endopeptidase family protein [Lacrimispora sp.]
MISIILHLILPMFFYTAVTTALFLYLNLGPLEATALSAILVSPLLYYFYFADQRRRGYPSFLRLKLHGCLIYILIFGAALCVLGNYMVEVLGLAERSVSYKEAEDSLYSAALSVQLLASGFLIPFAEEIIFRGLAFAPLREKFPFWLSAVLSAALFGLYHGNLPQGVYAFFIGLAVAWLYEVSGTLLAPYLFHVSANLLSLSIMNTERLNTLFRTDRKPVLAAVSAAVSVICAIRIYQKNNLKEDIL